MDRTLIADLAVPITLKSRSTFSIWESNCENVEKLIQKVSDKIRKEFDKYGFKTLFKFTPINYKNINIEEFEADVKKQFPNVKKDAYGVMFVEDYATPFSINIVFDVYKPIT